MTPSHDPLDALLLVRLNVAAFGEAECLGWWESHALDEAGTYVLGRLFPRTASWVALELSIEAARRRQDDLLGSIAGAVHLFNLGGAVEATIQARIHAYKSGERQVPLSLTPAARPQNGVELREALIALVGADLVARAEAATGSGDTLLPMGTIGEGVDSAVMARHGRTLAAGYVRSTRTRLIVPYLSVATQAAQ